MDLRQIAPSVICVTQQLALGASPLSSLMGLRSQAEHRAGLCSLQQPRCL
jgi:hypothetical protein